MTIKAGAYVVVAGRLGVAERPMTLGRVKGWTVTILSQFPGDGKLPHFTPDYLVHPAIVGKNVCRKPYLCCYCGLTHATAEQLDFIPRLPASTQKCSACNGTGWQVPDRIGCVECRTTGKVESKF